MDISKARRKKGIMERRKEGRRKGEKKERRKGVGERESKKKKERKGPIYHVESKVESIFIKLYFS